MSTFTDQLDADMSAILLDEFGEDGVYAAQGGASTFAARLVVGDPAPSLAVFAGDTTTDISVDATGSLTVLRAGILAQTTFARDPSLGDSWTVASGANRGVWSIESSHPDVGGGCVLRLRRRPVAHVGGAVQHA